MCPHPLQGIALLSCAQRVEILKYWVDSYDSHPVITEIVAVTLELPFWAMLRAV